jgi:sodium-coupled neutral amino acid transporter 11
MIGIPYALAEAGFGLGLLLLLLVAGLTDYSLRLMVRAAHLSGTTSYQVIQYTRSEPVRAFGKQ